MNSEPFSVTWEVSEETFTAVLVGTFAAMIAAVAVMLVVKMVRTWRPEPRARAVDSLSRSTNLVVPDELREPLADAVAARTRGTLAGGLVAIGPVIALLAPWREEPLQLGMATGIVGIGIVLACQTGGSVAGAMLARRAGRTSPRVARLKPLSYGELLAPVERALVTVAVVAGVLLPAIAIAATALPGADNDSAASLRLPLLLLGGLASGALGLGLPRVASRLASHRAIPGDEHALAWSDALAARTVRDIAYLVVNVSGLAAMAAFMTMGLFVPGDRVAASNVMSTATFYATIGVLIAGFVIVLTRSPERHLQRTVWPQFAADAR